MHWLLYHFACNIILFERENNIYDSIFMKEALYFFQTTQASSQLSQITLISSTMKEGCSTNYQSSSILTSKLLLIKKLQKSSKSSNSPSQSPFFCFPAVTRQAQNWPEHSLLFKCILKLQQSTARIMVIQLRQIVGFKFQIQVGSKEIYLVQSFQI